MSKNIGKIKEKLDELGREYTNASAAKKQDILVRTADVISSLAGNDAKYQKEKPFKLGELYDSMVDLIFSSKKSIFDKYTEEYKGSATFSGYLFFSAENRLKDKYDKEHPVTKISEYDEKERMQFISVEIENEDGETAYFPDILNDGEDTVTKKYEQQEIALCCLIELIALLSHQGVMLSGRKDNESSREFMRLLCTERFTHVCKQIIGNKLHDELKKSEMTLINSINIDFADHVQIKPCRSIEEFETIPYKSRKYFGIAQSGEKELEVPFDAKVYITFYDYILHKSISNSLISRKRKEFEVLLNSFLSNSPI
ncbi:MAG: hypothetical protein IIT39_12130 [Clostridia bacterium]|nr:hypothetical protein [Clostridia bacterium]